MGVRRGRGYLRVLRVLQDSLQPPTHREAVGYGLWVNPGAPTNDRQPFSICI